MTAVTSRVGTARQRSIDSQLDEFRTALEEQRCFRMEQLAELATRPPGGTEPEGAAQNEVTDALRVGATRALLEIEAAIARIATGDYGRCETCAADISPERLEILPMAGLCMTCARTRDTRAGTR